MLESILQPESDMENRKAIRCVVACNGNDGPTFFPVVVLYEQEQYDEGVHYEAAKCAAEDAGYHPYLTYDENDGPAWFFAAFKPEAYAVVDIEGEPDHVAGYGALA